MNKLNLLKFFCMNSILSYLFDSLEINKSLYSILKKSNNNINDILQFSIESKLFIHYKIIHIIKYHSKSKCIFLSHTKYPKKIFIVSVSKSFNNIIINFLSNPNRLKFKSKELDFINKKKCTVFEGVYHEIFNEFFYKQFKNYIINYSDEYKLIFIGYSINGISSLFLAYLTSILKNFKIETYSFAIPKFCNQDLINIFEEKKNLKLNIINYIYDPIQLFVSPFTLNFKNIIFLNKNSINIQNNHEINQDTFIKKNFSSYLSCISFKNHSSDIYFQCLIQN